MQTLKWIFVESNFKRLKWVENADWLRKIVVNWENLGAFSLRFSSPNFPTLLSLRALELQLTNAIENPGRFIINFQINPEESINSNQSR